MDAMMSAPEPTATDAQDLLRAVIKFGLYLAVAACISFGYRKLGLELALPIAFLITACLFYFGSRMDDDIGNGLSRWRVVPKWLGFALIPAIFSIAGNLNTMFTIMQRDVVLLEQLDEARGVIIAVGENAGKLLQSRKIIEKQARVDGLLSRLQSELTRMSYEGLGPESLKIIAELEKEVGPLQRHSPGNDRSPQNFKKLFERYRSDVLSQLASSKDYVEERAKEKDALRLAITAQVTAAIKELDDATKAVTHNEPSASGLVRSSIEGASRLAARVETEVKTMTGSSLGISMGASKRNRNIDSVLGTLTLQIERLPEVKTVLIFLGAILIDMLPLLFGAMTARPRRSPPVKGAVPRRTDTESDMLYRPVRTRT